MQDFYELFNEGVKFLFKFTVYLRIKLHRFICECTYIHYTINVSLWSIISGRENRRARNFVYIFRVFFFIFLYLFLFFCFFYRFFVSLFSSKCLPRIDSLTTCYYICVNKRKFLIYFTGEDDSLERLFRTMDIFIYRNKN